jgi:hypothetical protein
MERDATLEQVHSFIESITDIKEIRKVDTILGKRKRELEEIEDVKHIREQVDSRGCCVKHGHANSQDLDGLKRIELDYYVDLRTWDKEEFDDPDVSASALEDQLPWVYRLGYKLNDFRDVDYVSPDRRDWDWDAHDEPAQCRAKIQVHLYFKPSKYPTSEQSESQSDEKIFEIISEDGYQVLAADSEKEFKYENAFIIPPTFKAPLSDSWEAWQWSKDWTLGHPKLQKAKIKSGVCSI